MPRKRDLSYPDIKRQEAAYRGLTTQMLREKAYRNLVLVAMKRGIDWADRSVSRDAMIELAKEIRLYDTLKGTKFLR